MPVEIAVKIALIHYHLRTGGVTRVLTDQSTALTAAGVEHLVFTGSVAAGLPAVCLPELDYLAEATTTAEDLYKKLLSAFQEAFGSAPDLWHLHNPTLGKNVLFAPLVKLIAESQAALVLQTHDFAEDNRPQNYSLLAGEHIYPVAPQVHYAFINSRDRAFLNSAGLPQQQGHLLPNAIRSDAPCPPTTNKPPYTVLYPVRAIRRKNIGEVILLAALAPPETRFVISLAPENEQWLAPFRRWEQFAAEQGLAVLFDVIDKTPPRPGQSASYRSWQESATHLVTTSVAEGFGLTFLEPIALGKPLFGRDLPEITRDFQEHRITPGRLYSSIPIPLEAIDEAALRGLLESELRASYRQFGEAFEASHLAEAWEELTRGGSVDFGALPEIFQEKVILLALREPERFPLREWLAETLGQSRPTAAVPLLSHYSPTEASKRLLALYRRAVNASPAPPEWLPKQQILEQYLSPSRFHFLRS